MDRQQHFPGAQARETARAAATDLAEVADRLPVPAGEAERVARILDRISEECAEAAAMLRRSVMQASR